MKYVLQCEDSIEGIFSAVYSAWELKYGHQNTELRVLGTESENLELFAEYILLQADAEKSEKVLNTIRRTCSDRVYEQLFKAACSDAPDKADAIYRYIRIALKMGSKVANHLTDPAVVRIMELNRAVGNEQHHYLGFLRFIEIPGNILLARYKPRHRLTELIMPHFADRFQEERFVIWDTGRNVAGVYQPGHGYVMVELTKEQTDVLQEYDEDNLAAEQLWKAFVENISIKERENRKLQRNNLPLHFRTYMPEFQDRGECGDWKNNRGFLDGKSIYEGGEDESKGRRTLSDEGSAL